MIMEHTPSSEITLGHETGSRVANDCLGKTMIITGANSGIRKAAAIQLARLEATVILTCRSAKRGATAREELCQATGNQKIELILVDLSLMA